ncbi:MAG TPA: hypothetical protein VMY76_10840 [Gemmatimonadales bacterium]|nr:hypothetical protein [Gemmatimonadales bacterium]
MTRAHALAARLAILCLATWTTSGAAQWSVGAGVRAPRFSGGAVEQATGRSLLPYRPTVWELSVGRVEGRWGVGVRAHYASSSLALEGRDALAAVKSAITVYGIAPELSVRVGQLGPATVLRVFGGPLLEVWRLPDVGSHLRVGASVSVGLEVPFGGRWSGSARLGAAVIPSPFAQQDLDETLEPRSLWRREAMAGLSYAL